VSWNTIASAPAEVSASGAAGTAEVSAPTDVPATAEMGASAHVTTPAEVSPAATAHMSAAAAATTVTTPAVLCECRSRAQQHN
jgi:hypothetical protein